MADTTLHFDHALLPTGWAADVRLTITSGRIASVETGVSSNHRDARHAVALPGMPNLHSHAFQRAMAGLAEVRGTSDDSFWTWREAMYRFVERITPDDLTAIAIGLGVAFVVALAVVKALVAIVGRFGFAPFAWYRIILGTVALIWLGVR